MSKDYDYIAKVEKAIKEKYGQEAVDNPKKFWTKEKEEKYLKELKDFYRKQDSNRRTREKTLYKGILVSKNLINKKSKKKCPVCAKYSFDQKDDVYFAKFDACFDCYVDFIEDREQRWLDGWRPPKGEK
jgi:ribosome modulation factor